MYIFPQVVPIGAEGCHVEGRFSHIQALLYCYEITVNHLDQAWVTYRKRIFDEVFTFQAKAELPVLLHRRNEAKGDIVVCAAMLPHYTPFVEDWIQYQKTVGVDHIHMTLESSFLSLGSFEQEFLQTAVEESYLSVEFWHQWLNETDICDHSLDLALYGCVFRFQDSFSHIIFSDPRNFFIPRDPALPRLRDFLSHWCPTTHCHFEWKNLFYQQCKKAGSDGNVTASMPLTGFLLKDRMFTIYKSALMVHSSKNRRQYLLESSSRTSVPVEKGYFAHLGRFANSSDVRILPEYESC